VGNNKSSTAGEPYWLVWVALLLAGLLLLGDAYDISHLSKWTARLGIALVFSAVAMFVGSGRWAGNLAVVIIWLVVVLTYIF